MKRDRPWMPFYTADWLSNVKLKRCTHEEKGVWMDILCLMHESEEYGVLRWELKEIAHVVGCSMKALKSLISKGVLKGAEARESCPELVFTPIHARKRLPSVTILERQAGPIWYSSRMVEDEYKRNAKQGNNAQQNAAPKAPPNHSPKPPFGESFGDSPDHSPDLSPPTRARETEDRGQNKNKSYSGGVGDSQGVGPVDNSESPPLSADAIGEQLVLLEAERGRTLRLSSRAHEALLRLEARQVALPVLLRAHALACARRAADGDPSPVNPGFLEPFVDEALADGQPGGAPVAGWDETTEGVQAKAAELGIPPQQDGEAWLWFRLRVIRESGDQQRIEREVSKAERMNPNEFQRVYRFMYGVTPGQVAAA